MSHHAQQQVLQNKINSLASKEIVTDAWGISHEIGQISVTGNNCWLVNIGSGNGLVPSGNKPLPEPMLTQIYVVTWCH